jgi:hypothetical protein
MPTYEWVTRFARDFASLTPQQQRAFFAAVKLFVEDMSSGRGCRAGLRVKRVRGADDVWEITWAPDGRATWQYGDERQPGQPHVIWRRVGTHAIFREP